jgi:flagellar assembly protein FliH
MKAAAKFLFEEDFASGERPTITLVEAERRRADAESVAYRKGFADGQVQAQGEAAERIAAAMAVIADGLARIERALAGIEARLETEAVDVAVAVGNKLATELIAREPFAEIGALAADCFRQLVATPHVAVRIGPDIYDEAKHKLEEIAALEGFQGRLTVLADASLSPGDCRIEWAEGGVDRDRTAALSAIDEMVTRYVTARRAAVEH